MKGKSICRTCKKEFNWYRNKEQGPAKYCSKKCKDINPEWRKKSQLNKIHTCIECGKIFERYVGKKIMKFCSFSCNGKYQSRQKFKWEEASIEEIMKNLENKFEKYVIRQEGCWDWKGCIHKTGYAPINFIGNKQKFAHVISWILHYGIIPNNLLVLHKCDNRKCTNPEHLYLGTYKENVEDREERTYSFKGEKNPRAKLKKEDVHKIWAMINSGYSQQEIADEFGVNQTQISRIYRGDGWINV